MATSFASPNVLEIRLRGRRLRVGFGGRPFLHGDFVAYCEARLRWYADTREIDCVVVDFTGVKIVGTPVLRLLLSLRRRGLDVELAGCSMLVREVLELTRLDRLFAVDRDRRTVGT